MSSVGSSPLAGEAVTVTVDPAGSVTLAANPHLKLMFGFPSETAQEDVIGRRIADSATLLTEPVDGADLRLTNYGGGNTSCKAMAKDPLTGQETEVMWVKGSGGDLGTLTEAGRSLLVYARRVELDVRDAFAAVRELRIGHAGVVRLGVGVGIPQALVAAACKPLLAGGDLSIEIVGGMSDSLFDAVSSGEADFAITGVRPPDSARLQWVPLFRDPMIAVAHASHALAGARRVTWEAFSRERWIVANVGTLTRTWFEQQFRDRGLEAPRRVVNLRGYPHAYELAIAVSALLLVPACTPRWARDFKDFVVMPRPPDWKSDRVVGLLSRSGGYLGAAAQKMMDSFATSARKMFPEAALA